MGQQHNDTEPPADEPTEVLEGEVMIYRQYPGNDYASDDGRRGPRVQGENVGWGHKGGGKKFGPRSYDESLVREVINYRLTHPYASWVEIGRTFGLSDTTVRGWCIDKTSERAKKVDVVALRTEAAQHLEAARDEAWNVFTAAVERSDARMLRTALEALRTVGMMTGDHARLMGLNMPVKVDVQVTEITEAERELQELIREAQARAAAAEADVIAQASADPDL